MKQWRGLSWSVGGDATIDTVLTVPNILKKYNPRLFGYSLGSSYSEDTPDAYYNVASGGDTAVGLIPQSEKLVAKVTADKRQADWKLITIFIGGNDVCQYCFRGDILSPENFKKNIITTIDSIYNAFTNTIINLVGVIDMTQVNELSVTPSCQAAHQGMCSCLYDEMDPGYATRMSLQFQAQIEAIVAEAPTRWPRRDFAVSYQPQYVKVKLPYVDGQPDLSYFAPDCFHFSQKGHEHVAITLWNNMLKPAADRSTTLQFDNRNMDCPTEANPYIHV